MKKKLIIPKFKTKEEEYKFWDKIDLGEYHDASSFKPFNIEQFLKEHAEPKTTRITIRIPTNVVKSYKSKASKLDVPYQSLMKEQIARGI